MRQRGRPRHPDLLTPREWEVLSLVREGLSNREIGDRLGVSRDGIKYHISQILPKLGVSSREEAAAWQPPVSTAVPQATGLASRFSRISRVGLIGAAGALLAGLVALGGAVAYSELSGSGSSNDSAADTLGGGPPTPSPDLVAPTPTPEGTPAPPVVTSGELGSIAYVKDGDLWVLNLDTGDQQPVAKKDLAPSATPRVNFGGISIVDPEWSADGRWIAFGTRDTDYGDDFTFCWMARASDGLVESVGGSDGWEWSPTKLQLYSRPGLEQPVSEFPPNYQKTAAGTMLSNVGIGDGRWSPGGRYIAVASAQSSITDVNSLSPPYGVKLIDTRVAEPTTTPSLQNPSGVKTLFEDTDAPGPPLLHSWSPDGKYLLFWIGPGSGNVGDMAIAAVDGSGVGKVGQTLIGPSAAAWSPDGTLLAMTNLSKSITVIRPGGLKQAQVGDENSAAIEPAWSPSGQTIAFSKLGRIWTGASGGSSVAQLTNDDAYTDRYPQWSADGSRIVFVRLPDKADLPAEIWVMGADGSDAHKIGDIGTTSLHGQNAEYTNVDWSRSMSWYKTPGAEPLPTPPLPAGYPTYPPLEPAPSLGSATPTPTGFRID